MDKKALRNDIILISSLLLVAVLCFVLLLTNRSKENLTAKITVQNEVVEVIDLSKKEEKDYYIDGVNGKMHIHTHNGAIAVVESNCPHQDCVKMGYVDKTGKPIICTYNQVTITIDGYTINDVEIN